MWSAGCVLVEMVNGQPPFMGQSQPHQLLEIIKTLGTPSVAEIKHMNSKYDMSDYSKIPTIKSIPWRKLLKTHDTNLIDLIDRILVYSPFQRLTPAQAMAHPFFDVLRLDKDLKHK